MDVNKTSKLFLFDPENVVMKTSEASTKLGGFKQLFQMLHSNKRLSYSEPQKNDDDAINNFFSSVRAHDGTTPIELIIDTETLLTNVYAIGSKSSLNIAKVLQYRFREGGITINIWSDNAQKEFMGSVCKLLRAYGVGSKKYEAQKNNNNLINYVLNTLYKYITFNCLQMFF